MVDERVARFDQVSHLPVGQFLQIIELLKRLDFIVGVGRHNGVFPIQTMLEPADASSKQEVSARLNQVHHVAVGSIQVDHLIGQLVIGAPGIDIVGFATSGHWFFNQSLNRIGILIAFRKGNRSRWAGCGHECGCAELSQIH
ncbi:hypothetical protein HMF3257_00465 [Spirosoma telluris]|uniref:Uncharacterized protein n=1 Tax=Spirosoma telluris TaxID=2183553 RepID=A0A327NL33_9BACT|nr:hypothetical protein HMF3257_00465 [Spirosoma telluris]